MLRREHVFFADKSHGILPLVVPIVCNLDAQNEEPINDSHGNGNRMCFNAIVQPQFQKGKGGKECQKNIWLPQRDLTD